MNPCQILSAFWFMFLKSKSHISIRESPCGHSCAMPLLFFSSTAEPLKYFSNVLCYSKPLQAWCVPRFRYADLPLGFDPMLMLLGSVCLLYFWSCISPKTKDNQSFVVWLLFFHTYLLHAFLQVMRQDTQIFTPNHEIPFLQCLALAWNSHKRSTEDTCLAE